MTPEELVEFFRSRGKRGCTIRLTELDGLLLTGYVQLALRHPGTRQMSSAARIKEIFIEMIERMDLPAPVRQIYLNGFDPQHDVPADAGTQPKGEA